MEELNAALETLHLFALRHNQSQPGPIGLRFLIVQNGEVLIRHAEWSQTLRAGTVMLLENETIAERKGGDFAELQCSLPDSHAQEMLAHKLALLVLDTETIRRANVLLAYCSVCNDAVSIRHLIIVLLREICSMSVEPETQAPYKLKKILQWLNEHYTEEWDVKQLSERFHYNSVYLSRLFRQSLHITLSDYVHQLRMQKAAELLVNTEINIAQIAEETGYSNSQHFFRLFKQKYGMTPNAYRTHYHKGVESI